MLKQGLCETVMGPINSHSSFISSIIAAGSASAGAVGNTCQRASTDLALRKSGKSWEICQFHGEVR